ncbi:hypothetical protein PF010_g30427 [Phytophthora fragariae]|uniref:Uncharacterized protein n=1 Tax=Phytophthora fragariae TaxID=53985 RepID=A0A6A3X7C2_9STRA|nr:hypothetical protein PF009_g29618 [Phytophthora fragariae]KAE9059913.1 hypothetical protein PF010_g30427 [Phytophthora fragariae]KAE9065226.1 hypothetical protein PF006_g30511 [Phytophthora fragariae]KAE9170098.1 hypothetical protein PF004_g27982 [Phytophthora fragariae]KAE9193213.1 hypothetical protein PF002_g23967 [Phytophthora fragariae]
MTTQFVEGFTTFPTRPSEHCRYAISVVNGYIEIWLENTSTNEQWKTNRLYMNEVTAGANKVGEATTERYLKV